MLANNTKFASLEGAFARIMTLLQLRLPTKMRSYRQPPFVSWDVFDLTLIIRIIFRTNHAPLTNF